MSPASPIEGVLALAGCIVVLLWGMRAVREGILRAWGADLRRVLGQTGARHSTAFAVGFLITLLVQSTTATSLIAAALVRRRILVLPAALAIVLGADVAASVVAQLLSLRLSALWPVFCVLGFLAASRDRQPKVRDAGQALVGLGLMLLSLRVIGEISVPLRASPYLSSVLLSVSDEPILLVLIGAVLTWAAHSSLATMLFIVSFAANGTLTPEIALPLVLGVNLGGSWPAITATFGASAEERRVPLGNLVFKLAGVALGLSLLPPISRLMSDVAPDVAHQATFLHILFNVVVSAVFAPALNITARILSKLVPDPPPGDEVGKPRHLPAAGRADSLATSLAGASREALRMCDIIEVMLKTAFVNFENGSEASVKEVRRQDKGLDALHEAVKLYLAQLAWEGAGEEESRRYGIVIGFATMLEHVGDVASRGLLRIALKKIRRQISFSAAGFAELQELEAEVLRQLSLSTTLFLTEDIRTAREMLENEAAFRAIERRTVDNHLQRLSNQVPETLDSSSIHLDVLRELRHIHSLITSTAHPILEKAGELCGTRLRKPPSPQGQFT
ncbi:MAG: Na/Pi cotransporter family protein [Rhodospirillales bacterium]|nr:MAG: Na/Pi cotransporter family protein [Rhodospirillales bacterium]